MSAALTSPRERPILFTARLVVAIMRGWKTATRRVVEHRGQEVVRAEVVGPWCHLYDAAQQVPGTTNTAGSMWTSRSRYGQVGDRLWVQEGYQITAMQEWGRVVSGRYLADDAPFAVKLTEREFNLLRARKHPYRASPGRFMYRSLARTVLELTAVDVARLSAATDADAVAEGCCADPTRCSPYWSKQGVHLRKFRKLWDALNAKRGYGTATDPYVWVLTFRLLP